MPTKSKAPAAAAAVAGKNGHSLISDEKFRKLYVALVKYELLEVHLGNGTDSAAGAVGITLDLQREDTIVLGPRNIAANFIKGVPLRVLLDHHDADRNGTPFMYGAVNALTSGLPSAVAQAGLATGTALGNKMAGNNKVAVAFLEGGAATLAECRDALAVASANKLPVLFVIQADSNRKLDRMLAELEEMVPVITVDAHDVVAVYRVGQETIARAREGGPALIVCVPYSRDNVPGAAVVNMERYLTGKKLFRNRWKDQAIAEFKEEMRAACLPPGNPLA